MTEQAKTIVQTFTAQQLLTTLQKTRQLYQDEKRYLQDLIERTEKARQQLTMRKLAYHQHRHEAINRLLTTGTLELQEENDRRTTKEQEQNQRIAELKQIQETTRLELLARGKYIAELEATAQNNRMANHNRR
jgi:hypothetical protein